MKLKRLLTTTLSLVFFFVMLNVALAATTSAAVGIGGVCQLTPGAGGSTFCSDQTNTNRISGPQGAIVTGANVLSVVAGVAAIIVITLGGLQFITSGGDPSKVSSAKNMILYALIGLIVIVLAQTIIRFVLSKL